MKKLITDTELEFLGKEDEEFVVGDYISIDAKTGYAIKSELEDMKNSVGKIKTIKISLECNCGAELFYDEEKLQKAFEKPIIIIGYLCENCEHKLREERIGKKSIAPRHFVLSIMIDEPLKDS